MSFKTISLSVFNRISTVSSAMPYRFEKRANAEGAVSFGWLKHASLCLVPSAFRRREPR